MLISPKITQWQLINRVYASFFSAGVLKKMLSGKCYETLNGIDCDTFMDVIYNLMVAVNIQFSTLHLA